MNILKGIQPEKVFDYFEQISAIPRGSGHMEKISAFCAEFAEKHNLDYHKDEAGNVVIFKGASEGRENEEPVILQGHLDMVWEKLSESDFDFENDGLRLKTDGDFVFADSTTLGGDDGIAVAYCLAILDSDDISHPPLEVVFTTDEETGMFGAAALDTSILKGKKMINIDSEDEGTLWVSCAGGIRAQLSFTAEAVPCQGKTYSINISGLHGGHSGAEIHMGYANANKLMARLLAELQKELDFSLISIDGGKMDNAITRDCCCVIELVSEYDKLIAAERMQKTFLAEYSKVDPDIRIDVCECDSPAAAFSPESSQELIAMLNELPNGVIAFSKDIDGLVETSLNLGILKTESNKIIITFSVRSAVDSERTKLTELLEDISKKYGADFESGSAYPAWEFKKDSVLQKVMADVYFDMFGKKMTVTAIHAGLECGLFCGKIKGLDCVSFGPDIYDIHTPQERLSISSAQRTWEYILKILEKI